jgi:hypothetical protein
MKRVTMLSILAAGSVLPGCSGAYWGNLIVLGISAGIFFGTLSLGRTTDAARSRADSSSNSKIG